MQMQNASTIKTFLFFGHSRLLSELTFSEMCLLFVSQVGRQMSKTNMGDKVLEKLLVSEYKEIYKFKKNILDMPTL